MADPGGSTGADNGASTVGAVDIGVSTASVSAGDLRDSTGDLTTSSSGAVGVSVNPGGGEVIAAASTAACNFFRKPPRNRNIRKRKADTQSGEDDDDDNDKNTPTTTTTITRHKNSINPSSNSLQFSSTSSSTPATDPTLFRFDSSTEIQVQHDSRATATLETETDFSSDARALRERSLKQSAASLHNSTPNPDSKLYKGMNAYTDHKAGFRRELTVSGEKASGAHGPLRASAHIRMSARFDYQPDICKDYKETGYCGFGDSCKFMHDRGDYKSGWQMDKEWEEKEKARKRSLAMKGGDDEEEGDGDEDEEEEGLPFACFICRQPFVDPVMTKCKHYFCEHCALKHHSKNKKCFVCNKPTLGLFNTAFEIKKRTAREKKD